MVPRIDKAQGVLLSFSAPYSKMLSGVRDGPENTGRAPWIHQVFEKAQNGTGTLIKHVR